MTGHLTLEQKLELLELLEERERRTKMRKLFSYYPDEGPLRRELYPKHMEFFAAGATYRERCFMAANRIGKCSTHNSRIETPHGTFTVGQLYERGKPFDVFAWDGKQKVIAKATAPFKKAEQELCLLITMSDGQTFEAALGHRILTDPDGWLLLGDFVQLSRLRSELQPCPILSSWGYGPSIPHANDQHWSEKQLNFLVGCPLDCRLCDGQPPCDPDSDPKHFPLRGDVLPLGSLWSCLDGLVNKCTSIFPQASAHLSILGVCLQNAALYAGSAIQAFCTSVQRTILKLQGIHRLGHGVISRLQSDGAIRQDQCEAGEVCGYVSASESRTRRESCNSPQAVQKPPVTTTSFQQSKIELGLRPYETPVIAGNKIESIHIIGVHELFDFSVPGLRNYVAAGLVHHNTEGAGGYETALHLTGQYPHWWKGRVFAKNVRFWAAGKTNETTRDIVQTKLFGEISYASGRKGFSGTGLVPGDCIGNVTWKQGVANLADTVEVKHSMGGWSKLGLKSYQQGRGSFEGTEQDGIWLDEEPPNDIYGECLIRTATTKGIIYATFTPLEGMSEMAIAFLPNGKIPDA